jgi:uncharacterized protein
VWFCLYGQAVSAQPVELIISGGTLRGTLLLPEEYPGGRPLVILVSGSGPTDRDGSQGGVGARSLGMLADSLVVLGVPSFRYDKRGVGESTFPDLREEALRVDDLASDLALWVAFWEKDPRFRGLVLAGHSEGALMATLAAGRSASVKGLVTLAGAGRTADVLLMEQMNRQPPFVAQAADSLLRQLREGLPLDPPPFMEALFRPGVQPYLRSWIALDPARLLSALDMPVLIVQGAADLQVSLEDARLLHLAAAKGTLLTFEAMNHALKDVHNTADNYLSYYDPQRSLTPGLATALSEWILQHINP